MLKHYGSAKIIFVTMNADQIDDWNMQIFNTFLFSTKISDLPSNWYRDFYDSVVS